MGHLCVTSAAPHESPEERRTRRLRRFSLGVTIAMMVLCNAVFLLGIWVSGVNLDRLIRFPDVFNPKRDICLRQTWQKVIGSDELVQLCSEWINLSDPSGRTHQFPKDTQVKQGADGRLYFDHGAHVDYRLFVFVLFVISILAGGLLLKRYLVSRYKLRLDSMDSEQSSLTQ